MIEAYDVSGGPIKFGPTFQTPPQSPKSSFDGTLRRVPILGNTEPTSKQVSSIWTIATIVAWCSVFMVKEDLRKKQLMMAIGTTGLAAAATGLMGNA